MDSLSGFTKVYRGTIAMIKFWILIALALSTVAMTCPQPDGKWKWSDRESTIMAYFMRASKTYDVALTRRAKDVDRWSIVATITAASKKIFEWETHDEGAFAFSGDLLVYSNHSRIATGCEILAVDLTDGSVAWSTHLKGAGPISHSEYRNRINLVLADGKVTIYGNESGGQYIEILDVKTGEMISNTLGSKKGNTF